MVQVSIHYLSEYNTFIASDEYGNSVSFKEDRDPAPDTPVASSKSLSPMTNLLMSAGTCSAIDVVMILHKQRLQFTQLEIKIKGQREQNVVPALWQQIHIDYTITGQVTLDKAKRATELSIEKYCSVAETLRRAGTTITWDTTVIPS